MFSQLPLILGFAVFFALNLYLWSLPISHEMLCIATAPLGVLYFVGFMWFVMHAD